MYPWRHTSSDEDRSRRSMFRRRSCRRRPRSHSCRQARRRSTYPRWTALARGRPRRRWRAPRNDKRTRILLPDGWEDSLRTPSRQPAHTLNGRIPFKLLIAALEAHIETLKAQLTAAEARAEKLVTDFAERDAKHAAELAIERTLVDHMSARVDQLTAELAAERAMAERGLAAELARAWWKPLLRRS